MNKKIKYVISIALLVFLITNILFGGIFISMNNKMNPFIHKYDLVIYYKLPYNLINQNDIVLYKMDNGEVVAREVILDHQLKATQNAYPDNTVLTKKNYIGRCFITINPMLFIALIILYFGYKGGLFYERQKTNRKSISVQSKK